MGKLPATSLQHSSVFEMFAAKVFLYVIDVRSVNHPIILILIETIACGGIPKSSRDPPDAYHNPEVTE